MIYYRYLDLDYLDCRNQLFDYIQNYRQDVLIDTQTGAWKNTDLYEVKQHCPALEQLFKPLNLDISYLAFFVTHWAVSQIHTDVKPWPRINLPILNCDSTETRFYISSKPPVKRYQEDGVPYFYIDPDKCQHVDQYFLTKPVVFRPSQPHCVFSNNPIFPRISCTIGFHQNIEHLLYE
jgi:hypothetical protein